MLRIKRHAGVIVLLGFFALMILAIGIIYAYYTDGDTAVNEIKIGANRVEIIEDFEPPKELQPNISFKKDVKIQNMTDTPCFVRVKVKFTSSDMGDWCTLDLSKDWVYNDEDGYYYYPEILAGKTKTPSLFTTVSLGDIPPEQIEAFDVIVYAESVQAINGNENDYATTWELYKKNR